MTSYSLALSNTEKDFLYKKYIESGMTPKEAYQNIKNITTHLSTLVQNLVIKKKSDKDIQAKFREEFEKICLEVEARTRDD